MKIQSKNLGLALVYSLSILLVSGCTSKKDVVIEEPKSTSQEVQPQKEVINTTPATTSAIDKEYSFVNSVTSNINGQDITLKSVHFAFDKYNLTDAMRAITKENYGVISPLTSENSNLKIKLEGNCDEWGTDEYNYALGLKRAKTAKDALVNDGISKDRIVLVSFGESNPICNDKSKDCYKKNRRVDYRLLP